MTLPQSDPTPLPLEIAEFADEHESGQLRLAVTGEQMALLPLPDDLIPLDNTAIQDVP